MTEVQGILVTFLDQTGAKSIKARIAPTVAVSKIIPNIITKMSLPITAPDGQPMSYSLDHKEGGKRLQETQTLPDAGVKEGDHLIVYPEIVAGASMKITVIVAKIDGEEMPWILGAWDEYTMDANYQGFCDDLAKKRASLPGAEVRTAEIEVPEGFLEKIFSPIKVQGQVKEQET